MATDSKGQKEVVQTLHLFDARFERGSVGRQLQVGASAALRATADEIVRVMDGLNRYRFMGDPALLVAWESAEQRGRHAAE